jgi:UDP-N-acetylglucosamine--N-acetylmuramyl-(pentapeptide) pyrophosphoryl-undecaprenol N-acetylglucosamine transferase
MKVMFTGGGTLGPVTPLLAVAKAWKEDMGDDVSFVWVGTADGPERDLVESHDIPFFTLPVFRLPRYVTVEWLLLPFRAVRTFWHAWKLLRKHKPDLIATAGGFTGVPLIVLGKLFGVKSWVHQQDAQVLLSNRLVNAFANCVSTAWQDSVDDFSAEQVQCVGNPVRKEILHGDARRAREVFGLDADLPTVLVFGGGTGSRWLNHTMKEIAADVVGDANVLHITGKGKRSAEFDEMPDNYRVVEYLGDEMADAYALADLVVCRAGMGTITELAALEKPSIIIPLPHSIHQIKNALRLHDTDAAIVLQQDKTAADKLSHVIGTLLTDEDRRTSLGQKIGHVLSTDVADDLAAFARSCVKKD